MNRQPMGPQDPDQQKRLILAVALSLVILVTFHFAFERPRIEAMKVKQQQVADVQAQQSLGGTAAAPGEDVQVYSRDEVLQQDARIAIKTPLLEGSLPLTGNRIDDVRLLGYYETVEKINPVALFSPSGTEKPYYAEFGFIADNKSLAVPDNQTVWQQVDGGVLAPDTPVTLRWDNGAGLVFERQITVDDRYIFTVNDRVINNGDTAVTLYPYQLLSRKGLPADYTKIFILHQGPLSFSQGELTELAYDDLKEPKNLDNQGGWIGFADKYWFAGLVPPADTSYKARFTRSGAKDPMSTRYQADTMGEAMTVQPGGSGETSFRLFTGAKRLKIMNSYKGEEGLKNLDLAIDFGIWSIITKPLYLALSTLSHLFGHVAWGIILLTVLIRLALYPLNNKSFRSMAAMKKIAPELKDIQQKHKGDTQAMQMKIMELYQREGVNPFSGCWPILLQIPIFFALYKVIMLDIDMRHAPFPGWIKDMSIMDPTSVFNLFGLLPYDVPGYLVIGGWPILMGMTMAAQRRLNPPPADPIQAKMMAWMPVFFTFILAKFAAGLVIYWTWSNFLGVLQQYSIMRRMGVDVSLVRGYKKEPVKEQDKSDDESNDKT